MATTPIDVFCPTSGRPGASPATSASTAPRSRFPSGRAHAGQDAPRGGVDHVAVGVDRDEGRDHRAVRQADRGRADPALHGGGGAEHLADRGSGAGARRCPPPPGRPRRRARPRSPPSRRAGSSSRRGRDRTGSPPARSAPSRRPPGSRCPSPPGSARPRSRRRGRRPTRRRAGRRGPAGRCSRGRGGRSRACPGPRPARPRRRRPRASATTTVQPVGRRVSVKWPTRRPGTSVRPPADAAGAPPSDAPPPSPARATEGQATESPAASAAEKPRRSISLMKPPESMLAPRRHARASDWAPLCQILFKT